MSSSQYTEADFERAMRFIAWLIELYGDAYWPVFDWLEEELDLRRKRTAKLKQYAMAQNSAGRAKTVSPIPKCADSVLGCGIPESVPSTLNSLF